VLLRDKEKEQDDEQVSSVDYKMSESVSESDASSLGMLLQQLTRCVRVRRRKQATADRSAVPATLNLATKNLPGRVTCYSEPRDVYMA